MRLKSLKLAGFKSFANPTTFTFRHGITAIVGPNGCGKSNVIDAIRWVLGESSAKQLRGGAMSDVIFAGTESKAAKSMASVELTFEHTQDEQTGIRHELNLYHELSIRRQINLEGKSDYFINGTRCRRRDVIDVFLGTGLGSRSYAVIQQGMIGRIVDSSPLQLREFIEEAAGVSRYQARREETQKKLETTQDNLARLDDVRSELARQKKTLAKQAESAEAYQSIKDELSEVQQKLAIAQLTEAKLQELEYKAEQQRLGKSVETASAQLATLKSKIAKLESRMAEAQWLKDDAQDRYHQHELARQQADHQLISLQEKIEQSERRIHGLQSQIERSNAEAESFNAQHQRHSARLTELTLKFEALSQQLAEHQARQLPLEQSWQSLQAQVNEVQSQIRALEQQQALQAQAQSQLDSQQQRWQRQQQQWQQQVDALATPSDANNQPNNPNATESTMPLAEQIDQLRLSLSSLSRQQEDIQERMLEAKPKLAQWAQALSEKRQAQQTLEKRHASLSGEYDSLHRMLNPPKPVDNSVNALKQPNPKSANLSEESSAAGSSVNHALDELIKLPKLSEQIELTAAGKAYSEILDYWLAFWLDSLIVTQSHSALKALFAQNIIKDSDKAALAQSVWFSTDLPASEHSSASAPKSAIALSQLIAKPHLSIWQSCYLYTGDSEAGGDYIKSDEELSATLAALPAGSILLTARGWLISSAMAVHISKLTGQGKSAHNAQFLTQRLQNQQRLAELEDALTQVEDELEGVTQSIKQAQVGHDELAVTVEELNAQANALTHNEHEQQRRLMSLQAQFERQQAEQSRLDAERQRLDQEQRELKQAQDDLALQVGSTATQLTTLQPQFEQLQAQQTQLTAERQAHQQSMQDSNDTLQNIRFDIKEAELAARHAMEQSTKISAQQSQLLSSIQATERSLAQDQGRLPKLQEAKGVADNASHEQLVALEEHKASLATLKQEHSNEHQALEQLQANLQRQQLQLAETTTQVAIFAERIRDASERLEATGASVSASTILTEVITHGRRAGNSDKHQASQQQWHQREAELSAKLAKMGPVNLAAAAELKEIDARLLPLEQQIEDISASMDTLKDAIATIDTKTKALFMQTLEAVNTDLARLFAKVFGGGRAHLSLQDDESLSRADKWRAGLELMAQPKGKKNSRLAVLSGGEKTLTALSLIFAIFKQHPAPFCVLDEVDAPLDDANVARFTSLIHELADDVQFIFISHNKLAMQIADELKGITMPQPGVSTLVSVSLEEAEKYIEA